MAGSLNQQDVKYHYIAAGSAGDYSALPSKAAVHLAQIKEKTTGESWRNADGELRASLAEAQGCIDRLSSFLLQVSRMANHAARLATDPLVESPIPVEILPDTTLAVRAHEVCADFESLLFHARASLDRLTWFVSRQHGQKCNRFSRLPNVVSGAQHKDPRAVWTLAVVDMTSLSLPGILLQNAGSKSLRDRVAHYSSLLEGVERYFTLHCLEDGRLLLFDCEAFGYPVLATSRRLSQIIPFAVQNVVAIYLGLDALPLDEFAPSWPNPSVAYAEYVTEDPGGQVFGVVRMEPDGFRVEDKKLRPEVLTRAFRKSTQPG